MRLDADRVTGLLLLIVSIAYGVLARGIDMYPAAERQVFNARTLPYALSVLGSVIAFLILILPTRARHFDFGWREVGQAAALLVLSIGYAAALRVIGFFLASSFFLALGFVWLGERSWKRIVLLPVVLTTAFELLLVGVLDVYLVDPLLEWMGMLQ